MNNKGLLKKSGKTLIAVLAGGEIIERVIQRASLVGHVVEDLIYENISPTRFQAELVGQEKTPEYKQEGYFVFSNLSEGHYTLKITGQRLQPAISDALIPAAPAAPVFLDSRGDNELIVIVRSSEDVIGNNGGKKINFDPVILTKEIRAGARVFSNNPPSDPSTRLAARLEPGVVSSAKIEFSNGFDDGAIVRIIRDKSIRMNFDPYFSFASPITRVVGKVVSQSNPAVPLPGAQVRLTEINGALIDSDDVQGVEIFTGVDTSGNVIALGTERDIATVTNEKGDYNLYFNNETLASFKITDQTLTDLQAEGVPADVLTDLEDLKDRIFRGQERFLIVLRETIDNQNVIKYQPLILEYSENFIQNLTLEVTLTGFNTASITELINTGERIGVNFELIKI